MQAPIQLAATVVIILVGGCAGVQEQNATADDVDYAWQEARNMGEPIRPDCRSKLRRTGSRIPRCPKETSIHSKAHHMPGRGVDDRTGRRRN